jgi:replicative DNA helicase
MGGGLYEGRVYGFAGREKAGKTTLAHTMSYNLSKQGVKHLYVAMEMGAEEIHTKNIARDVGVNSLQFLTNRDDMKKYAKDADYRSNIIYADLAGGRINEILGKVAIAKQLHGISGFFLDYLQIIEGAERGENRAEFLLRAAQSVANFTKRTGLWCVMLAQLNEDGTVFQTSGLRKACDQLYALQSMEAHNSWNDRWLRMDASRYTPIGSLGNPTVPYLRLNQHVGTYFDEVEYLR